ncbi:MAG: hypothetical protein AAF494_01660 [Pseudomonadota bacterium]
MASDPFESTVNALNAPAESVFAVAPADASEFATSTKALYVGDGGDIVLRAVGDDADVTFVNVPAGAILPVRVKAVRETGTTAANIVGLI